jgi:phage tail tape-measure protein
MITTATFPLQGLQAPILLSDEETDLVAAGRGGLNEVAGGAGAGAAIGSAFGPVGTVIGGAVGGFLGWLFG